MTRALFVYAIALCGSMLSTSASADWILLGAAYRCVAGQSFTIDAVMETSSPNDPGTVLPKPGFTKAKVDQTARVRCRVGKAIVDASIRVTGPRAQGAGAGSGDVSIDVLTANGQKVLVEPETFNLAHASGPAITSITIYRENLSTLVEICRGQWDWGVGYGDVRCEKRRLDSQSTRLPQVAGAFKR